MEMHGMRHTRVYRIWRQIKTRCTNPKVWDYKYYGGRGITICEEWKDSFIKFWEDNKEGYKDNLTIDRIDRNQGYTKLNCRWVTRKEQMNNFSRNRPRVMWKGKSYNTYDLAKTLKIERRTLERRLDAGVPTEVAVLNLKGGHLTKALLLNKRILDTDNHYKGYKNNLRSLDQLLHLTKGCLTQKQINNLFAKK